MRFSVPVLHPPSGLAFTHGHMKSGGSVSGASHARPQGKEGMAMPNLPLVRRRWAREKYLLPAAAAKPARPRFNPATNAWIAGSVAAQQTHERGLAASDPDGTLALMPPAAPAPPWTTRNSPPRIPTCRAPLRIALGERKNDMTSLSARSCAAARRQVLPRFEIGHAACAPATGRRVFGQLGDDAQSGVPDGGTAVSGE